MYELRLLFVFVNNVTYVHLCRFKNLIHTLLDFHFIRAYKKCHHVQYALNYYYEKYYYLSFCTEKLRRFYFSDLNARTTLRLLTIFYVIAMYCASLKKERLSFSFFCYSIFYIAYYADT